MATSLRSLWARFGTAILWVAVALMAAIACVRFAGETWRLVGSRGPTAAIDLGLRHGEVGRWFAGLPVYTARHHSGYPPASYVLLWPFMGWLALAPARWLWAGLNAAALALATRFVVRQSGAGDLRQRAFVALAVLAPYPLAITFGNGQLGTLLLPAAVGALWLLDPGRPASWRRDGLAAILLTLALAKPSLSAPFVGLAAIRAGRWRPVLLVGGLYAAATALAEAFRPRPLLDELVDLVRLNDLVLGRTGAAHVAVWLTDLGLAAWIPAASLLVLGGLFVWQAWNRRTDLWVQLAVTGIVGRVWTYHSPYDDSLLLPAVVALIRIAGQGPRPDHRDVVAAVLLALLLLPMLVPGRFVYLPWPWTILPAVWQPLTWTALVIYFIVIARRDGKAPSPHA